MVNKKFKVIEEGRLNRNKLGEIVGGKTCLEEGDLKYRVVYCKLHAECPIFYGSCTVVGDKLGAFLECKGLYKGQPGPDGFV
jgi:hypothetical protein